MNDWIVVPNWERFQHYGLRRLPAWIKVYTSLNSHDAWNELTFAERGLLVTIWLEYARSKCRLKVARIPSQERYRYLTRHLESLNRAGFIHFSASPEVEVEVEEEILGPKEQNPWPTEGVTNSRPNASAYSALGDLGEALTVDPTALEQAKKWIAEHERS